MSGEMAAAQNDLINDDSIREECEELIACEDAHPVSAGAAGYLSTKGRSVGEWIASRPWGQLVFKSVDRVLWCIERTMLWQNPNPDSLVPMVRPVSTLVAYPLAALLWVLQHLMFVTAETSTSSANELIKWVQTRRRRLRAVRFQGIRNMRKDNVLGRPEEASRFAQVFWFLGLLPAGKVVSDEDLKKDLENEKDAEIRAEDSDSEQKKKRRHSSVSATTEEDTVNFDDEYNSESDSDYVPDYSHSSESDSDLSSVDEEEDGDLNESIRENQPTEKTEKTRDHPTPKD